MSCYVIQSGTSLSLSRRHSTGVVADRWTGPVRIAVVGLAGSVTDTDDPSLNAEIRLHGARMNTYKLSLSSASSRALVWWTPQWERPVLSVFVMLMFDVRVFQHNNRVREREILCVCVCVCVCVVKERSHLINYTSGRLQLQLKRYWSHRITRNTACWQDHNISKYKPYGSGTFIYVI